MSSGDRTIALPGVTSTLRVVPGLRPRHTVVFLHGLLGDGYQWDVFNHHSPPRMWANCLYLDYQFEQRRGAALTFAGMMEDTVRLLHAAGVRIDPLAGATRTERSLDGTERLPVALVGSSFGGHIALYLASRGYLQPENLVLFASGGIQEAAQQRGLLKSYRTVDKIFEISFDRIFSEPRVAENAHICELLHAYKARIQPHRRVFIRNLLDLSRNMMDNSLSHDELRRLETRTLLVWGVQDIVTPPEIGQVFAGLLPNSALLWVDAGHASHVERADVGSRALRAFCLREDEWSDAAARAVARSA